MALLVSLVRKSSAHSPHVISITKFSFIQVWPRFLAQRKICVDTYIFESNYFSNFFIRLA